VFSAVGTALFGLRNLNKDDPRDWMRKYFIGDVQLFKGAAEAVNRYDNAFTRSAKSAVSVFADAAKQHKVLDYAGKALKWSSDNVNPLLCISGGVKVLMSDDKTEAFVNEVGSLGTMFLGEYLVKQSYDKVAASKAVTNALEKVSDTKLMKYITENNMGGKISAIIKGVTLVGASIGSYALGKALSKDLAKEVSVAVHEKKSQNINQKV